MIVAVLGWEPEFFHMFSMIFTEMLLEMIQKPTEILKKN